MPRRLFFDTYALLRIYSGNPAYTPYLEVDFLTTRWNLLEYYYQLRKDGEDRPTAEQLVSKYHNSCVEPSHGTLFGAGEFRLKHKFRDSNGKVKRVSYADAVGYQVALDLRIPFLTGDQGFRNLPNVEFVR